MTTPKLRSMEIAIRIYYENLEIGTKEIRTLFLPMGRGKQISTATVSALKRAVSEEMIKRGVMRYNAANVNTKVAYEVWGLDIKDIEYRYNKLQKLGGA